MLPPSQYPHNRPAGLSGNGSAHASGQPGGADILVCHESRSEHIPVLAERLGRRGANRLGGQEHPHFAGS